MSDPRSGTIAWQDLTVPVELALRVRDFYKAVANWQSRDLDGDWEMLAPGVAADVRAVAGICHARGGNEDLPPQWLVYIVVEDLAAAARRCEELGGKILRAPRGSLCIIQDPAGAVCALYQPGRTG